MVQKAQPYKYQVYNEIKRGILKGQYVPGDVLTERRLSEEMGISRTPIREAMQMLEHDGWLVVEISEKELKKCLGEAGRLLQKKVEKNVIA